MPDVDLQGSRMAKLKRMIRTFWPHEHVDPQVLQQACRLAARGRHSTLFNLLIPICIVASFSSLYFLPMLVVWHWASSGFAPLLLAYLKWSLPVLIVANLLSYHWARNRMLAPYLKQLTSEQKSVD
jgi:hypothetical protein